jgi:hypothetical protein
MNTYIEVFVNSDGEKASVISETLFNMGLEASIGQHDFVYRWKKDVTLSEVFKLVDQIQNRLRGTGALLKFTTV